MAPAIWQHLAYTLYAYAVRINDLFTTPTTSVCRRSRICLHTDRAPLEAPSLATIFCLLDAWPPTIRVVMATSSVQVGGRRPGILANKGPDKCMTELLGTAKPPKGYKIMRVPKPAKVDGPRPAIVRQQQLDASRRDERRDIPSPPPSSPANGVLTCPAERKRRPLRT